MQSLTGHARWHSRAAFLTTTLMVLVATGAPFHVTAGLLAHGALFLPATLLLLYALGTPLTRLALAMGQTNQPVVGRDSLVTVQWLLRLILAGVLLYVAAQAAGWIFARSAFDLPDEVLRYQTREITAASAQWHAAPSNAFLAGAACVVGFAVLLGVTARKSRLTGLSWLGTPLLGLFVATTLLGVFVAYSLPGAGALASVSAPVRTSSLFSATFWVDAGRVALLAMGAQAGLIVASGRGLPARAEVGREARVLVCGMGFVLVIAGLAGLLLLCGLCVEQGIVPQAIHASPTVLVIDLVPALGDRLFVSWPAEWRPSPRRIAAAWCFVVALSGSFGAAALLISRSPVPDDWRSRAAKLGFGATAVIAAALVFTLYQGKVDPLPATLSSLPALLGWMRLTLIRRGGAGLRVAKAAFESRSARVELLHFTLAFFVARPLLPLLVALAAYTEQESGVVLGGIALGFALIWIGSLQEDPVRKTTMRIPKVSALLCLLATGALGAATHQDWQADHDAILNETDAARRGALRAKFEQKVYEARYHAPGSPLLDTTLARAQIRGRAAELAKPGAPPHGAAQVQDATAALLLIDESVEAQQLEHELIAPSTRDAQQLLGLIEGANVRDVAQMKALVSGIDAKLKRPNLGASLDSAGRDTAHYLVPLLLDMREAWGTAGPEARIIRREFVLALTRERSLLLPSAAEGVTYIACFVTTAAMLALSLLLARRTARA